MHDDFVTWKLGFIELVIRFREVDLQLIRPMQSKIQTLANETPATHFRWRGKKGTIYQY
jgi:hypothetical protein